MKHIFAELPVAGVLVAQYLHNEFHDVRSHVFDQKTTNHAG